MRLPEFTASSSLYASAKSYGGTWRPEASGTHLIPALPSCKTCDYWSEKCDQCIESGGSSCRRWCNRLQWCGRCND